MDRVSPILKWAGGKRQLLSDIIPLVPTEYQCYYEPFVGAGAVLFALQPQNAVINDTNAELINVYKVIKNSPEALVTILKDYEKAHCKDFFYEIRKIDRSPEKFSALSDTEKAARTIYLNRTCYNGLYRVNKNGYFNTPVGRNSSIQIVNESGIHAISNYLNTAHVQILNTDYKTALEGVSPRDFVFLDPPYFPTNRESFLRYDVSPFNKDKQEELERFCDDLNLRGVKFIETNANCKEIKELYVNYQKKAIDVRRCINANADERTSTELIIYNY